MNGNGNDRSAQTKMERVDEQDAIPIVLVIAEDGLLQALVRNLTLEGYLVFGGRNEAEVLQIVIGQSRPIHILLADVNMNGRELARGLKSYRPDMQVLFISMHTQGLPDVLDLGTTLSRVRQLLKPLKEIAVDAHRNGLAVRDNAAHAAA